MATATTKAKNDDGPPAANDPLKMEDFQSTFSTESLVVDDDADDFDPFQIGTAASTDDIKKKTQPSGNKTSDDAKSVGGSTVKSSASSALPPRLLVKFQVHEEVSSLTSLSDDSKGSSDVHIEGTLLVSMALNKVSEFRSAKDSAMLDEKVPLCQRILRNCLYLFPVTGSPYSRSPLATISGTSHLVGCPKEYSVLAGFVN